MMATLFDLVKEFSDWVQLNQVCGIDGTGNGAYYVSPDALDEYWDNERINNVLLASSNVRPINVSVSDIRRRFIHIFSTLLYISKVSYITNFFSAKLDDHNLPLEDQRDVFSTSDEGTKAWEHFNKFQFLFNPLQFGPGLVHNRTIPPKCILPLDPRPIIISGGEGNKPVLKKYTLQKASKLANIPNHTIVMKEFNLDEDDSGYTFDNEMEAYIALENNQHLDAASEYFLQYYGSFKQNGKGFLLLEYADRGSLDQFFSKEQPPHEWDELYEFWSALLNLIRGLVLLHNLNRDQTNNLRGIHQDLKPANIFVFKEGDNASYKFRFKIGDFGLSSVRLHNVVHPDNKTTKMYGAPELANTIHQLSHLVDPATSEVDIWSLGCILFETAVWTVCGERGRSEFMLERQHDNKDKRSLCENGYQSSFHDGKKRLGALDRMLERILARRRIFDNLTEPLAILIFKEMLLPHSKAAPRLDAKYLERFFNDVLETCRSKRLGQGDSATPPKLPSPSSITPQYSRDQQGSPGYGTASNSGSPTARTQRGDTTAEFPLVVSPELISNTSFYPAGSPTNTSSVDVLGQPISRRHTERFEAPRSGAGSGWASLQGIMAPNNGYKAHATTSQHGVNSDARYPEARPSNSQPSRAGSILPARESEIAFGAPTGFTSPMGIQNQPPPHIALPRSTSRVDQGAQQSQSHSRHRESTASMNSAASNNVRHGKPGRPTQQPIQPRSVAENPYPMTTVTRVLEWMSTKKDQRPELPGRQRAISFLDGREQIFVVEDSISMRDFHWADVTKTFKALSYLVKGCDPNGIELYLLSNPSHQKKGQKDKTRDLVEHLKLEGVSKTAPSDSGSIESSFSTILARLKNQMKSDTTGLRSSFRSFVTTPNLTKANIYFLTDAKWGPMGRSGPAIAQPIRTLVNEMRKHDRDRTDVSIQFIQFGADREARKQLKYLDDTLGNELQFDIVDRRSNRSNVWYMLLGSMNRETDNIQEDSDSSDNESEVDNKEDGGMYTTATGEQRWGAAQQNFASQAPGDYPTPFQQCLFPRGQKCTCGYHEQFGYRSNNHRPVR